MQVATYKKRIKKTKKSFLYYYYFFFLENLLSLVLSCSSPSPRAQIHGYSVGLSASAFFGKPASSREHKCVGSRLRFTTRLPPHNKQYREREREHLFYWCISVYLLVITWFHTSPDVKTLEWLATVDFEINNPKWTEN